MVCPRCVTSVEQLLKKNDLRPNYVRLGEVELSEEPGKAKLERFAEDLIGTGFELLDYQKTQVIEQVRNLLIQKVQSGTIEDHFSIAKYITPEQIVFKHQPLP